jgi:hypothetical protein
VVFFNWGSHRRIHPAISNPLVPVPSTWEGNYPPGFYPCLHGVPSFVLPECQVTPQCGLRFSPVGPELVSVNKETQFPGPGLELWLRRWSWQAQVAHACNPSYSGGKGQEDCGLNATKANSLSDPISKNPSKKKVGWLTQVIEHLPSKHETNTTE